MNILNNIMRHEETGPAVWQARYESGIQFFLRKGQGHGVEQHGSHIEHVAIQHAGGKKRQNGDENKGLFAAGTRQKQFQGLEAVMAVSNQAKNAAGCQNLNKGIVPPGGEE